MAIFDPKSRYVKHSRIVVARDRRGREVAALMPAEPPAETPLGDHRKKDYQRLDHLAAHYLEDDCGYWRLAEINNVIVPDALAEAEFVTIPVPKGG